MILGEGSPGLGPLDSEPAGPPIAIKDALHEEQFGHFKFNVP